MTRFGPNGFWSGKRRRCDHVMPRASRPGGQMNQSRAFLAVLLGLLLGPAPAMADVFDVTIANVTTRAFSLVWVSDEPVDDATVGVFRDPDGQDEITADLSVTLVSRAFPPALDQGIVMVDVTGLAANVSVYVQTETISDGGTVLFPASAPLLEVTTAAVTTKANANDEPIVNDLILKEIFDPDGVTPTAGTLLLVDVPSVALAPLAAFVGDGFATPAGAVDLNNVFDGDSKTSAEVLGGEVLKITEFRGLLCNVDEHRLVKLRRVPEHEETPRITELEQAAPCFSPNGIAADFNCDGTINPIDFNEFLIQFGLSRPDCKFNSDFDLSPDDRIDPIDFNEFLIVFGMTE